jgi:hypothetical protein
MADACIVISVAVVQHRFVPGGGKVSLDKVQACSLGKAALNQTVCDLLADLGEDKEQRCCSCGASEMMGCASRQ